MVDHNEWDEYLTLLEFAYNDSIQASIHHSPFFLNIDQQLIMLAILYHPINPNNPTIEEII